MQIKMNEVEERAVAIIKEIDRLVQEYSQLKDSNELSITFTASHGLVVSSMTVDDDSDLAGSVAMIGASHVIDRLIKEINQASRAAEQPDPIQGLADFLEKVN